MGFHVCAVKGNPAPVVFPWKIIRSVFRTYVQDDHINVVKWHRILIKGAIASNKIENIIIATISDLIARENPSC